MYVTFGALAGGSVPCSGSLSGFCSGTGGERGSAESVWRTRTSSGSSLKNHDCTTPRSLTRKSGTVSATAARSAGGSMYRAPCKYVYVATCVSFCFSEESRLNTFPASFHASQQGRVMRSDNSCTCAGISHAAKALSGANVAAKTRERERERERESTNASENRLITRIALSYYH